MINEGAKILGEGIALNPSDIDLVFLHGYGFPKFRGGPMFYAEQIGLAHVLHAIEEFAKEDAFAWPRGDVARHMCPGMQVLLGGSRLSGV